MIVKISFAELNPSQYNFIQSACKTRKCNLIGLFNSTYYIEIDSSACNNQMAHYWFNDVINIGYGSIAFHFDLKNLTQHERWYLSSNYGCKPISDMGREIERNKYSTNYLNARTF
jgi:hypothetical protein